MILYAAAIFLGALGMLVVGIVDDRHELRARTKFIGQVLIAVMVAASGIRVTLFVPNLVFSYVVTVLWILTVINAFNFMDGIDGIATSEAIFFISVSIGFSFQHQQNDWALLQITLLGPLLGFLVLNWPPAKIFMGDIGSTYLGMLLPCILT